MMDRVQKASDSQLSTFHRYFDKIDTIINRENTLSIQPNVPILTF
jgi:hypothetical protein